MLSCLFVSKTLNRSEFSKGLNETYFNSKSNSSPAYNYFTNRSSYCSLHHFNNNQSLLNANNSETTSIAVALLHPSSVIAAYQNQHNDLLLQHMQKAASVAVPTHVISHRRRKARTVFSDHQLHGLEKR